ncbi:urease accessory protein UreD [Bradyrhizobium daqingense]|uniref:urease accessory protein UreD n=1 Tax=Bradyrhizobium daqingense TaxID=993502 RepID=UPI003832578E
MRNAAAGDGARLDLSFVHRADRTVIDRRVFTWPFVLTRSFHVDPDRPNCLSVIVQTASGAVHGEDSLVQRLTLGPGTAVCLTNQGATSVHRADPAVRAVETVRLDVASGASLEYLPEPRILFPDAALYQSVELDCANDACALIVDAFTMHDPGGESRCFRELESTFCLRRSIGEPSMVDRTRLCRPDPGIFRGYRAFGSAFLVLSPSHDLTNLLGLLTGALGRIPGVYGAASLSPGQSGLGVRLAALELRHLRQAFEHIKAIYRQANFQ